MVNEKEILGFFCLFLGGLIIFATTLDKTPHELTIGVVVFLYGTSRLMVHVDNERLIKRIREEMKKQ